MTHDIIKIPASCTSKSYHHCTFTHISFDGCRTNCFERVVPELTNNLRVRFYICHTGTTRPCPVFQCYIFFTLFKKSINRTLGNSKRLCHISWLTNCFNVPSKRFRSSMLRTEGIFEQFLQHQQKHNRNIQNKLDLDLLLIFWKFSTGAENYREVEYDWRSEPLNFPDSLLAIKLCLSVL